MRPIERGPAPQVYARYEDAKPDLVNLLGLYCSYCERRIATLLAVEHIQAKALPQYAHLKLVWENFLLGCVNCNSAKLKQDVILADFLLPDRDNTFAAYRYDPLGTVEIAAGLTADAVVMAEATRDLTALNRLTHSDWNDQVMFSALERVSQRVQAWVQASEALADFQSGRSHARAVAREAAGCGFFSIWMAAFDGIPEVRRELIDIFPGTAVDCFDSSTLPVTPRPPNGLADGSKL